MVSLKDFPQQGRIFIAYATAAFGLFVCHDVFSSLE
jgi:hypothetical protein